MAVKHFTSVTGLALCVAVLVIIAGCSNSKLRRTPQAEKKTPWFCEMNEHRDDWDCVQDGDLARNPKPQRLPGDLPVIEAAEVPPVPAGDSVTEESSTVALVSPAFAVIPVAPENGAAPPAPPADTGADTDLLTLSGSLFAVQLIAMSTVGLAEDFIARHGLDDALSLELAKDGEHYHVVLLGIYETFAEAEAAVENRPESLSGVQPWIRPLESIQTAIREARGLAAAG